MQLLVYCGEYLTLIKCTGEFGCLKPICCLGNKIWCRFIENLTCIFFMCQFYKDAIAVETVYMSRFSYHFLTSLVRNIICGESSYLFFLLIQCGINLRVQAITPWFMVHVLHGYSTRITLIRWFPVHHTILAKTSVNLVSCNKFMNR